MTILSQRDLKWANEVLGTQGTIGNLGCTITCISMLLGKTPSEVNQSIKNVNGYAQGNLVDWAKLPLAFSQIKSATRVRVYDNDQVKQAIEKNGGCLVEVNGSRIGASKHWVLYIGGGQMYDPWFGTQKTTNYYPPTGFAVLEIVQSTQEFMQIEKSVFESLVTKSSAYDEMAKLGYINPKSIELITNSLEENIRELKAEYDKFVLAIVAKLNPTGSLAPVTDKNYALQLVDEVLNEKDSIQKIQNIATMVCCYTIEKSLKQKEDEIAKTTKELEEENLRHERELGRLKQEIEDMEVKHTAQIESLKKRLETVSKSTTALKDSKAVLKSSLSLVAKLKQMMGIK